MAKQKEIEEILTHYTDDNFTSVDVYFRDTEEGESVALVDRLTSRVIYKDAIYRLEPRVTEAINEVLADIKAEGKKLYTAEEMAEFGKYCIRQYCLSKNGDTNFTTRLLNDFNRI